jgi:hypothetical protein
MRLDGKSFETIGPPMYHRARPTPTPPTLAMLRAPQSQSRAASIFFLSTAGIQSYTG